MSLVETGTMPFARPPKRRRPHDELVRIAIREERMIEAKRRLWESESAQKILAHRRRGMSVVAIERIFGADLVQRVIKMADGLAAAVADGAEAGHPAIIAAE